MKKIPKGAEASNILVGEVDFLDKPLPAFIRLLTPSETKLMTIIMLLVLKGLSHRSEAG